MGRRTRFEFVYDSRAARYRNRDGRFLSERDALEIMEGRIDEGFEAMKDYLADALAPDTPTTLEDWQAAMAEELRHMHVQMLLVGKGGINNATPADYGRIGAKLRGEYEFLQNFAEQIASGSQSLAQINNRMAQYSGGVWSSYWKGRNAAVAEIGATHESRNAVDDDGTCDDCKGYERQGIVEIGTLPAPGEASVCRHRCRCTKEYYRRENNRFVRVAN